jgi:HSP20 family molecular chaperone IbpA
MSNLVKRNGTVGNNFFESILGYDPFKDWSFSNFETKVITKESYRAREEEGKTVLEIELPGVKKKDVDVQLIQGGVQVGWKRDGKDFSRTFALSYEPADAEARLEDGILTIRLTAKKQESGRRVEVK